MQTTIKIAMTYFLISMRFIFQAAKPVTMGLCPIFSRSPIYCNAIVANQLFLILTSRSVWSAVASAPLFRPATIYIEPPILIRKFYARPLPPPSPR